MHNTVYGQILIYRNTYHPIYDWGGIWATELFASRDFLLTTKCCRSFYDFKYFLPSSLLWDTALQLSSQFNFVLLISPFSLFLYLALVVSVSHSPVSIPPPFSCLNPLLSFSPFYLSSTLIPFFSMEYFYFCLTGTSLHPTGILPSSPWPPPLPPHLPPPLTPTLQEVERADHLLPQTRVSDQASSKSDLLIISSEKDKFRIKREFVSIKGLSQSLFL
jgi:hypothetical protein